MTRQLLSIAALTTLLFVAACSEDKKEGCTDPTATNYDPEAETDNGSCTYTQDTAAVVVTGNITESVTWEASRSYILQGFVYVKEGVTLTIEPGTIIKGDKESKGTLIIERGAMLIAAGTTSAPIVFTSKLPAGQRSYGDWGGIIVCGRAPINVPGGQGVVEGGTEAYFGGNNADDNSGVIRYVRIEFAGIAFQPNQEINGLTLAGVGRGTQIDHVQVSYCGDDSFEWFGGTVNCKYLVAHRGWDDDFDTDNGYSGSVQFAVGFRDPLIADASGSNGFESDNDAGGTNNTPNTKGVFSNVSCFGPKPTSQSNADFQFESGMHLRSNTRLRIFNTVVAGYPEGIYVKGNFAQNNATADELVVRNSIVAGCDVNLKVDLFSTFNITDWFNANGNEALANTSDLQVTAPFNLTAPNPMPMGGSPLLSGASFSDPLLNQSQHDITPVTFRGAFGTENWTLGWTNFDPQNTVYQ
jgi:hypothetical protein